MLREERYEQIRKIVDERGFVTAQRLSEMLYVSLPTVRRDLAVLAEREQILRSRGGACRRADGHFALPLSFRNSFKSREKKELCRLAATFVRDGDRVFIDASTTVLPLSQFLRERRDLLVVTNGMPLATLLCEGGIRTYGTGGELSENSLAYAGSYAEDFVSHFRFDIVFFSSYGISADGEIVDVSESESALRRAVFRHAKKIVYLCDAEKFDSDAPYIIGRADAVDRIVTNAPLPPRYGVDETCVSVVPAGNDE